MIVRRGQEFWDVLKPFCLYYDNGLRSAWHHGEAGDECRLAWHIDRELYWLLFYTAGCLRPNHMAELATAPAEPIPAIIPTIELLPPERSEFAGVRPGMMKMGGPSTASAARGADVGGGRLASAARGAGEVEEVEGFHIGSSPYQASSAR